MSEKEIVFTGKQCAELLPFERGVLGNSEVRGRTLATLVSPGTELAWLNGDSFPIRPGYSAVFEVEEAGADVRGFNPGDRLFCMGAHRSIQCCEAQYALRVPDGMAPEIASIARLMGVSMTTLMTTRARPGDMVIVSGAGPVGLLAAHQFQLSGYDVHVVEPDRKRRELASSSGLAQIWESMPQPNGGLAGQVALVVDCSGHEQAVLDGCRIVRKGGEVVLVGVPWRAQTRLLAHEVLQAVFTNYVTLRSGWEWELPLHARSFKWEELYEGYNNAQHGIYSGFRTALTWLQQGRIPVLHMTRTLSPADPAALYTALTNRELDEPFIVLDWKALPRPASPEAVRR